MESAGTEMGPLNANVLKDFTCLPLERNALTTMSASKQACVPMVFVPTWMALSNVNVMMGSSCPYLAWLVQTLMNARRTLSFACMEGAEIPLVLIFVNVKKAMSTLQMVVFALISMSVLQPAMFVVSMEDVSTLMEATNAFVTLVTPMTERLASTSMNV